MRVPTLEKQDQESGLVVLPLAWVHSGVAMRGALLRPELSSLGYAGVCMLLTPTAQSGYTPFLSFLYNFPYSTFTWTGPAGTPSICNTFLSAAD